MVKCTKAGTMKSCAVGSEFECHHVKPHAEIIRPVINRVGEVTEKNLCKCPCGPSADGCCGVTNG